MFGRYTAQPTQWENLHIIISIRSLISIIFVWEKYVGYDYVCTSKMQESAVHLHFFIVTGLYQAMHLLVLLFEPSFRVNEIELLFHDFLWRLLRDTYYIFSDNHHNWDHKTFSSNWKKAWRKGELRIVCWMGI